MKGVSDMTEKVFEACDKALPEAMGFLEETLEEYGCPLKTVMRISVCFEEIFVNIAHYAYPEGTGEVTVCINEDEDEITVTFIDTGIEFDPTEKADPDISLSADSREIGGLGIFMVKKSMDKVKYERIDGKNIFSMTKAKG